MADTPSDSNPGTLPDLKTPFHAAVREQLSKVMTLSAFMDTAKEHHLTLPEHVLIVEQATLLLEENYAHPAGPGGVPRRQRPVPRPANRAATRARHG